MTLNDLAGLFQGHECEIAYIFLMVHGRRMVNMKHIGKFTPDTHNPQKDFILNEIEGSFQGQESVHRTKRLRVAPMPVVPINKNVHHCPLSKCASWPLTLNYLYWPFDSHEYGGLSQQQLGFLLFLYSWFSWSEDLVCTCAACSIVLDMPTVRIAGCRSGHTPDQILNSACVMRVSLGITSNKSKCETGVLIFDPWKPWPSSVID